MNFSQEYLQRAGAGGRTPYLPWQESPRYGWAVVRANVRVARLIVDFRRPVRSAILKVYAGGEMGDLEHTIVANSITLTPGTITVDFSPDRKYMYVHLLDADDVETARRELLSHLETHFGKGLKWWKSS